MRIQDITDLVPQFVGVGFLLGGIPLLMGLGIHAVINIFKKI
ncbi:hypothetical protein [Otoolea muris]|nr:hypothetical protein [Otoolea muris]